MVYLAGKQLFPRSPSNFSNTSLCTINFNKIMNTGTIKKLVAEKKFGFITPDAGGNDVFFHESSLVGVTFEELKEGDKVSYDIEQSEKGPRAKDVKRV